MPQDTEKTQIGIRLPASLVRQIDRRRQHKTRAEYCRELIESALAADGAQGEKAAAMLARTVGSLQEQISEIRQSSLVAERDAAKSHAEMKNLRQDLATAVVGMLTKIGQAVRQEDQRHFARKKAEQFVKETFFSQPSDSEALP